MAKQGTPQAVIEAFTALDFKSNASYVDALKLVNFYNSFNRPSLTVKGVVAIQAQGAQSIDATILSFSELRALGVGEGDRIYLALDRRKSEDEPQGTNLEIVGLAINTIAKASNNFEAFAQLVQAVDTSIENEDLPTLLIAQPEVKEAAQAFLDKNLPSF
jgi:hypothetical protein